MLIITWHDILLHSEDVEIPAASHAAEKDENPSIDSGTRNVCFIKKQ